MSTASEILFRFWIDQHNLTIVARDSIEISPVDVSHLHIQIGQLLDLIVTCDQNPSLKYTIFAYNHWSNTHYMDNSTTYLSQI